MGKFSHFDTIAITKVESWEKPGDAKLVLCLVYVQNVQVQTSMCAV